MSERKSRIYIIKSASKEIRQAEAYLKNRGWPVASGHLLKECLLFIIKNKPDYILISADHPQKKVFALPQLIKQAFNICVIGFSENLTQTSFKRLEAMQVPFKMNQAPSGPAIERMILNTERRLKNAGDIKTLDQNTAMIQQDAQKALAQFMKFDADVTEHGGAFVFSNEDTSKNFHLNQTGQQGKEFKAHSATPTEETASFYRESLIAQGVESVLQKNSTFDLGSPQKISLVSKATCIIIDSQAFTGYLIAVFGENREVDETFLGEIKTQLFAYLKENGHTVQESELLDLKLNTISFNRWAFQQAEFLKKTIHSDQEVAFAFFPIEKSKLTVKFESSKNISKLKMDINELKANVPLEFDVYLHMESNDKYLLYTPQNFPIYEGQLNRLKSMGISHLHIRKDQSNLVRKYHVQNYLNQKIDDYNTLIQQQTLVA